MKERLRAMFCDHLSVMRGKYLPNSKLKSSSTRFSRSTFGVHYDRDLLDAPGAMMKMGMPDMELEWQAEDIRDSWHADTKIVLGDLYDDAGAPLSLCPRGALKRAIADWGKHGLKPMVGIELEAFALQADDNGRLMPYDVPGHVVYGTGPLSDPLRFNDRIWAMADQLGFSLDMITSEYDAAQFEYTLTFDNALKAVDDIVIFRLMAREIALEYGIILTFMPKPIAEAGGSGMHINFSFQDETGGNALSTGELGGPDHLNDLSRGALAGLLHHHKGLAGLIAPTANSLYAPAARIIVWLLAELGRGPPQCDHPDQFRRRGQGPSGTPNGRCLCQPLHRHGPPCCKPRVWGMKKQMPLQPIETGDGFDRTDAKVGTAQTLAGAAKDLAADTDLATAVGSELVAHQVFMKQKEARKTRDLEGDALRDFYIYSI